MRLIAVAYSYLVPLLVGLWTVLHTTVNGFSPLLLQPKTTRSNGLKVILEDADGTLQKHSSLASRVAPKRAWSDTETTNKNARDADTSCFSRRSALVSAGRSLSSTPLLLLWSTFPSVGNCREDTAAATETKTTTVSALDCLRDLPPFDPATTVRLYLCRHGETENNRLNLVQGARVDAAINETGQQQSVLLGQALARAAVPPTLIFYSPLQRTQQTALLAARQLSAVRKTSKTRTLQLDTLAEVDFGEAAEGAPVIEKRAELVALYTAWALGNLDARMDGGGESGRQVSVAI
jgi:Histidine phosphatase superfamily (branch 1)